MLYLSTESNHDTYTAYRTIHADRAPDGGLFLPFRLPRLDTTQIDALAQRSYCGNLCHILNLFFGSDLKDADLEYILGKYSARYSTMNHHVIIGELWHNSQWNFDSVITALSYALRKENQDAPATQWVALAARIAAIFGLYGLLLREKVLQSGQSLDIALPSGDYSAPMAAWYAREMGLPVGTIIIGCNENSALWDLFNLADIATGETILETLTPLCDHNAPAGLTRYIYCCLGGEEARRFEQLRLAGRHYVPSEEDYEILKKGMFVAVSSISRIDNVIRNVNNTVQYILSPYDALAYGALLDYRSKSGQGSPCMLLSERCPICDDRTVAYALGISTQELADRLQKR
jgi:threonine synthase